MKEVQKEKVQHYTVYQAVDGTEFSNREECEKYESSARGVVLNRFSKLVIDDTHNEYSLFGGDEEHNVYAVTLNEEKDKDTVLQLFFLDQPHMQGSDSKWMIAMKELVERAYVQKEILLMETNCDGEFYFVDTVESIIKKLEGIKQKRV